MTHCNQPTDLTLRNFLRQTATASIATMTALVAKTSTLSAAEPQTAKGKPTEFQHACMTLPYSGFPLERALTGIKSAGYRYVAWGVKHREANG